MQVEHGAGGRSVRVEALPLGIPFTLFGELAASAPPAPWAVDQGVKVGHWSTLVTDQVVLAIDTLDFTKGLLQRVAAFERLLDTHQLHRGRVVMVQVCLQSRTQVTSSSTCPPPSGAAFPPPTSRRVRSWGGGWRRRWRG